MRRSKEAKKKVRPLSPLRTDRTIASTGFESSPSGSRQSSPRRAPSSSLLDRDMVTDEFDGLRITTEDSVSYYNPRSFPYSVKQQCWEKAEKLRGRDPDRWRRDALGNVVFRKLVGCPGCLCHDYDHILPYSKGGQSTLENCQVLQRWNDSSQSRKVKNWEHATVNRSKGNRTEFSKAELIQKSSYCRVSGRDMDLLELSAYGNVRRGQDSGGCRIQ